MKNLEIIKKEEIEKVDVNLILNPVGSQINKQNKMLADKVLIKAKEVECEQKQKGSKWMHKGKTSVLVPSHKIEQYKLNGFR